jgi:hypothetical protein
MSAHRPGDPLLKGLSMSLHIPYFLTLSWWRYCLWGSEVFRGKYGKPRFVTGWRQFVCRWRGHPCGVVWFNAVGLEPDMHCRECGDDLG